MKTHDTLTKKEHRDACPRYAMMTGDKEMLPFLTFEVCEGCNVGHMPTYIQKRFEFACGVKLTTFKEDPDENNE